VADSKTFEWVCGRLEEATEFSAIEARGTVRIALKKGGVTAAAVTAAQMQVIVKRVLPEELLRRGCDDAQQTCDDLATRLKQQSFEPESNRESPEDVFARLGPDTTA
jgi:hypothetical protein